VHRERKFDATASAADDHDAHVPVVDQALLQRVE
jgi:hypothetical protein